ncbi:fumarylacetoacetate hydrolase family protein [Frankia sp. AgKG'84/4]|uniref:fumarylacetoacetate hydrolase family protein n=1 Tax=Frankia sp. AgKG'84/4 TaxID=573490 RepID=UPI00200D32E2|nr:fumarylacetoacetate hydrolase family protein [Frankia sp. AgKG'84/4]MCL9796678.1 fumarylacetoacetate hydrolase family protein [Frankia sp. AgKG'84/4]
MRFTGLRDGRRVLVGLLLDATDDGGGGGEQTVVPLADVDEFYADLPGWTARARQIITGGRALADVVRTPPVPAGARVLGMGLNYHDHAAETGQQIPRKPPLFGRWTASLSVDGTPVPVPPGERGLDWEGELAAVVGMPMTDVDEATAAAGVFGYAVFNDLSARRAQGASAQWTLGKNADRSGPMGPVVTADEVGDPAAGLRLVTRVNDEIVQDGDTADMIFTIGQILSFVSRTLTLHPGDILITGTPAGVGYTRTPPRYLTPGDVVTVEIERLGRITTPIVDAAARP